jgi:hypothetical protein
MRSVDVVLEKKAWPVDKSGALIGGFLSASGHTQATPDVTNLFPAHQRSGSAQQQLSITTRPPQATVSSIFQGKPDNLLPVINTILSPGWSQSSRRHGLPHHRHQIHRDHFPRSVNSMSSTFDLC